MSSADWHKDWAKILLEKNSYGFQIELSHHVVALRMMFHDVLMFFSPATASLDGFQEGPLVKELMENFLNLKKKSLQVLRQRLCQTSLKCH